MKSIWAHTLVKNEEHYLWYSVTSLIDFVDKVLLWDTGSTDHTSEIIKELLKKYPDKIEFNEVGEVTPEEYTEARQEMLNHTEADWFLVLDGDEVWWEGSIRKISEVVRGPKGELLESIVSPYFNLVGDIYHHQEEGAGRYKIDGREGHLTIRFMNRGIPGLYTAKPHGQHGYYDENNILVQNRSAGRRMFIDAPYLHFTHLIRSSSLALDRKVPKRDIKFKHELGKPFPRDFYYPEVFFRPKPDFICSPWESMDTKYFVRALIETPLRKVKRRVIGSRTGY
jgi:glycosyltransferase involved in cell wall biosynthesis